MSLPEVVEASPGSRARVFRERQEQALAGSVRPGPVGPLEHVAVQPLGGVGVAGGGQDAGQPDARVRRGPRRPCRLRGGERLALELLGLAQVTARNAFQPSPASAKAAWSANPALRASANAR